VLAFGRVSSLAASCRSQRHYFLTRPCQCHQAGSLEIIGDGVSDIGWFTRAQCETMDLDLGLFRALMKVWSEGK
jgi:hypothetical protein